jgi:hypothetical protein
VLVPQREGAPVHAHRLLAAKLLVDLYCLRRVDVLAAKFLTGIVSSYRQQAQVELPVLLPNLLKHFAVPGVA